MIGKLIRSTATAIPEGGLKNWLRKTILNHRIAAPRELMVNKGDTVVQVGMWRPVAAKSLARAIGPKGRIMFAEVSDKAIDDLKKAMENGPCKNVSFFNRGAWDSPGELELLVEDDPAATRLDTGMLHPGHGTTSTKMVAVDTIANMCAEAGIDKIDYIEITVNGAELHALKGMGELVKSTKRVWIAGLTRDPDTGKPLNIDISEELQARGVNTKISKSGKKVGDQWGKLDGHVYGWQKI